MGRVGVIGGPPHRPSGIDFGDASWFGEAVHITKPLLIM